MKQFLFYAIALLGAFVFPVAAKAQFGQPQIVYDIKNDANNKVKLALDKITQGLQKIQSSAVVDALEEAKNTANWLDKQYTFFETVYSTYSDIKELTLISDFFKQQQQLVKAVKAVNTDILAKNSMYLTPSGRTLQKQKMKKALDNLEKSTKTVTKAFSTDKLTFTERVGIVKDATGYLSLASNIIRGVSSEVNAAKSAYLTGESRKNAYRAMFQAK